MALIFLKCAVIAWIVFVVGYIADSRLLKPGIGLLSHLVDLQCCQTTNDLPILDESSHVTHRQL